ncbi:MAG: hypothetical protein MJ025_02675 [Victivallaceae bacterium]|nr:hypothetical protein [Victivallaceae bacterium]
MVTFRKVMLSVSLAAALCSIGASSNPWEAWRLAYTHFEQAETQRDRGNYTAAADEFAKAEKYYRDVQKTRPDWNQKVIVKRLQECERELRKVKARLGESGASSLPQLAKDEKSDKPVSGLPSPGQDELRRKLADAEYELAELRKTNASLRNIEGQVSHLIREKRIAEEKHNLLQSKYDALVAQGDALSAERSQTEIAAKMESEQLRRRLEAAASRERDLKSSLEQQTAIAKRAEAAAKHEMGETERLRRDLDNLGKMRDEDARNVFAAKETAKNLENSLKNAKDEIESLRKETERLKSEMDVMADRKFTDEEMRKIVDENTSLKGDVALAKITERKLRSDIAERDSRIAGDETKLKALSADWEKARAETAGAMEARRAAENRLAGVEHDVAETKGELEFLRGRFGGLEKDMARVSAERDELKARCDALQKTMAETKVAVATRGDGEEIEALRARLERARLELKKRDDLENDMTVNNKSLSAEVASLRRENSELAAKAAAMKIDPETPAKLADAERRLADLQHNFEALRKENQENRALAEASKPREAELANIKLRLLEMERTKSLLGAEQRRNAELAAGNAELKRQLGSTLAQAEELNKARARLAELEKTEEENASLRKINFELTEAKKLEPALAEARVRLAELGAVRDEVVQLRKLNDELNKSSIATANELSEIRAQKLSADRKAATEIAAKDEELNRLRADNRAIEDERKSLSNRVATGEAELKVLRDKTSEQERKLKDAETSLEELADLRKRVIEMTRNGAAALEAKMHEAKLAAEKLDSALRELDKVAADNRWLKNENESLAVARNAADARLESMRSANEQMKELNQAQDKNNEMLRQKIAKKEAEVARLRQDASDAGKLADENKLLRTRTGELSERLAARERELAERTGSDQLLAAREKEMLELEKKRVAERVESEKRISELEGRISDMQRMLSENSGRILADAALLKKAEQRLAEETAASKLMAAAAEEKISGLEKRNTEIANHSAELEKLLATSEKQSAELETLRGKVKELENANVRLAELNAAQRREAETRKAVDIPADGELKKKAESMETEIRDLRQKIGAMEKRMAEAAVMVANARKHLDEARQESQRLAEENVNLGKIAAEREQDAVAIRQAQARIDRMNSELEQLRTLNRELAHAKALEPELIKLRAQSDAAAQTRLELEMATRENARLNTEIVNLRKNMTRSDMPLVLHDDEIMAMSRTTKGNPGDFVANGIMEEAGGNIETASWNYEQALRIDRNYVPAAARLGRLLMRKGNYERSAALLSLAHVAKHDDASLAIDAAEACNECGRFGNALGILEPLATANKANPRFLTTMAISCAGVGDTARAENLLRLAVSLGSDSAPRMELARHLLKYNPGKRDEAFSIYEKLRMSGIDPDIELEPAFADRLDERRGTAEFMKSAASEAAKQGHWQTVSWYYKQLMEMDWNKREISGMLAFSRFMEDDLGAALETVAFNRLDATGTLIAAMLHFKNGDKEAGKAACRQAVELNGGKPIEIADSILLSQLAKASNEIPEAKELLKSFAK